MAQPTERTVLKRILDHYDQLGVLRERLNSAGVGGTESDRLRLQSRRKIDAIGRDLKDLPVESALGSLVERYKLSKFEFVVLLALLRRRLTNENPYMKGRELLSLLFDSSFDILRGCTYLESTANLQSTGLVVPDVRDEAEDDDLLETPFKISDRVFRLVRNTFLAQRGSRLLADRTKSSPYRSNSACVLDWRRLSLLYRKRAAKIFQFDYWDDVGLGTAESVTALNQQIHRFRERMDESLKVTRKAEQYPFLTLRTEYDLGDDELLILVTLLFQELTEGSAFLDAVDLLKLISSSEEDLLKKRRFFHKRSPLVRQNLVALEETTHDKELTAEVYLPNWVVDRMLGGESRARIDADARLDFHEYLKNLNSAEEFFDDLESTE